MISLMRLFERKQGIRLFGIWVIAISVIFLVGSLASEVGAQTYPTKSITLISSWPAGASQDNFTRAIAPKLTEKLSVPMDIICKPGGGGTIGTLEVMRARPDGYTLLIDNPGASTIQKAWSTELPYKVEDRVFIVLAAALPTVISVPSTRPWKTLKDVEEAIRKDPEDFKWTIIGNAHPDLTMRLFKGALIKKGVDLSKTKSVPFVGGTPAYTALAGGHTDIYSGSLGSTGALISAGKLRPIAVTTKQRTKFLPDVPTTVEQGFPTVIAYYWIGYSGPPGLPDPIVQKWINVVKEIMNDPAMIPAFDKLGVEPSFLGGADFRKFVMDEAQAAKEVAGK